MKTEWSKSWVSSKQPRKQRKYVHNAPLHIRHKLVAGHLSKELRKKYNTRSLPIRKKDKVKILRGKFRGVIGEVEEVNLRKIKIYVKGAETKKDEGRAIKYPIHPSNILILELNLDDKKRKAIVDRFSKATTETQKEGKEDVKKERKEPEHKSKAPKIVKEVNKHVKN